MLETQLIYMKALNKNQKYFLIIIASLVLTELFSFFAYEFRPLNYLIGGIIIILALVLSFKDLFYGFLIIIIELLIGSQGYLFSIGTEPKRLSLRMGLWIVVMAVWFTKELVYFIKHKHLGKSIKDFPYLKPLLLLVASIVLAALIGYWHGNATSLIFTEGKRWIYLITIIPFYTLCASSEKRRWLIIALAAAGVWIAFKSFAMLFVFSHEMPLLDQLYAWTRYDLLGEITLLPNKFTRVFLQSQIFAIPAFFISIGFFVKKTYSARWQLSLNSIVHLIAISFFFSIILISLSRSFWIGTVLGLLFGLILYIFCLRPKPRRVLVLAFYGASVAILSAIFLVIAVRFPFPRPTSDISSSILTDRATEFEAGAASRWSLLPVMLNSIKEQPILGQGLGKTLTYNSSDPRVKQTTASGMYTTDAFEWGWFDLWLKLGLLGLAAYIWFLLAIAKSGWNLIKKQPELAIPILASLVALVALHFFTPYLNHPLGFGYLSILMALSQAGGKGLA